MYVCPRVCGNVLAATSNELQALVPTNPVNLGGTCVGWTELLAWESDE